MNPIRVMIVEDSPTVRRFLCTAIDSDPRLEICAECETAEQALASLDSAAPDVISMDIQLPRLSGLEATRRIMETRPTPIVIVSRCVSTREVDSTMEALRAGAVSALEKPTSLGQETLAAAARRIRRELVVMSQVHVIRQRFNAPRPAPTAPPRPAAPRFWPAPPLGGRRTSLIGIVASTGGPHAVETILAAIGPDHPTPIVLVQHIAASFQAGFISWLDRNSPQTVTEAATGDIPQPGCVYVAPAKQHLLVRGNRLALDAGPPVEGHRPAGTVLLQTMAETLGPQAVGVVLTGMGEDGAAGLLAIRRAGGYTITEHESTAVVNGMPQAARDLGASCHALPLEAIGAVIQSLSPRMVEAYR